MKSSCLEALNKAFTEAGSRFIVVGGLAVAHGYLRATQDADIVIELLPDNIERAFAALESLGYKPTVPITPSSFSKPENRRAWTGEKNMTVLQFWSSQYRVRQSTFSSTFRSTSQASGKLPIGNRWDTVSRKFDLRALRH